MPLELRLVTSANEVPEIIEGWMKHEAHLTQPLVSVNWGTDKSSHKDRVKDLSARHWFTHSTTSGSVWLKVVDTDLGDVVVAASRWVIHSSAASTQNVQPARAYWLPPCPERRFMEAISNNFIALRPDPTRQKPHVHLGTNYTLEDHRRRGANTLMIDWGTRKADELGLETWLEATPLGSKIYEKHGFGFHHGVDLYPSAELREDNDEWRHWEQATKDLCLAVMVRPIKGMCNDDRVDVAPFPAHDLIGNVWLKEVQTPVIV